MKLDTHVRMEDWTACEASLASGVKSAVSRECRADLPGSESQSRRRRRRALLLFSKGALRSRDRAPVGIGPFTSNRLAAIAHAPFSVQGLNSSV